MSDKFLNTGGSGSANLSNGTINAYLASLTIAGMKASMPLKTNSVNTLVSTKLDITDINSLESRLNAASQAGYELQLVSTDELNDIDYKTDYDKTTWSNTTLNTHNFYNYYATPHKPILRTPFVPLDRATNVFNEVDLDLAIAEQKDNIFIAEDFPITSSKFITHACKISSDPVFKRTLVAVNIATSLFNVSADNVFFENLILENANTSSNCNCIYFGFNNDAKNNAVHNCVLRTNEFAIISDHYQIQIYNNVFEFTGTADSHRYINLTRCNGEALIYENTFSSNGTTGSPNTACMLINSPNGSTAYENGHLVIYKNSSVGVIQRMAIMETEPINFKLSLLENTIETNTDFFILFGGTMLNGFSEITAYENTVTLLPTSLGFKGLVGWDGPSSEITYCPIIRGSLNNLPSNLRVDYSPLPNLANILCYKNTVFTTSLTVPLNPSLVAFGEIAEGIAGPVSSVDNSMVFFDGTTGKALKENTNFKFITGATYGDQLKVPDIETDDHFSLNEELATMDTAISLNTTNNTGSVTIHSDVSNAGSGKIITDDERNNISSNVAKLVNTSAVQFPNPITTIVGELDVSKIKSYEHNCELEFNDTDAILTADSFITNSAVTVLNSTNSISFNSPSINLTGVSTTNQTSFTADQQIVSKKYVDDANTVQNTAITNITDKTQNIVASSGITTFTGTIASSNVKATSQVAIGNNSGTTSQGTFTVAIGNNAGTNSQLTEAIAIGPSAGNSNQGQFTVAVGGLAGAVSQQDNGVSIGTQAGRFTQGLDGVAIGFKCGYSNQEANSVAVGKFSGNSAQGTSSVAVGAQSGQTTQGAYCVALGEQAGNSLQGQGSVAIGSISALEGQGLSCVSIGSAAAQSDQKNFAVAVGNQAGRYTQGLNSVAIGNSAGHTNQPDNSIILNATGGVFNASTTGTFIRPMRNETATDSVFYNSGTGELSYSASTNDAIQNITAVAGDTTFTGTISSSNLKATNKIAIGTSAGTVQMDDAIAIGTNAGLEQKCCSVAIGRFSGSITQQKDTIGIGNSAGYSNQQEGAVALGYLAGGYTQGVRSIAIGYNSGQNLQGTNSIAIGTNAGFTNQSANSIILNATGTTLNASTTGLYIRPMKNQTATNSVFYNSTTGEMSYSASTNDAIQNINASANLTEFTGEVSVDNPHEKYTTIVNSVGTPPAIWTGGVPLQSGILFTPTKNIKMTKLYLTERMFITYDNLPRVSIFGTSETVPLLVFDVDESTKFTPDESSYGYYVKDIQFEFQKDIQYSIQSDLYDNNGLDPNVKTYPAVLGPVFYGFRYNATPVYGKIGSPQVSTNIPFIFDCEDNDYDNHFTSNGNNLSKDIYGAGGVLDKITVRASNMLYNMKNTAQTFEYPDGIGYKSMFYNPSIGEICYGSKEVVNDFYYTFEAADAPDFHKDNMLIFNWTQSTGNLQVRSTGALPTGMYINSCLIGSTAAQTKHLTSPGAPYDLYTGGILVGGRLDTFMAPNSVIQPGTLMPSYHIITYRQGNITTVWIKRIQNNT